MRLPPADERSRLWRVGRGRRLGRRPYPDGSLRFLLACSLLLALLFVGLQVIHPRLLSFLENRWYDQLLTQMPAGTRSSEVVIVDLDERSLERYGRWPWPRSRVAQLLSSIQALGPRVIGLDILFADLDSSAAAPGADGHPDQVLAKTLTNGTYVLGYAFSFDPGKNAGNDCFLTPLALVEVASGAPGREPDWFRAEGVVCNLPELAAAASAAGFFNVALDRDGILRRAPLFLEYQGRFYPSLALAMVQQFRGNSQLTLYRSPLGAEALGLGNSRTPLDPKGNLLLRFRGGQGAFATFSALDLLEGRVNGAWLRDKMVVVGTSAAGLREQIATPLANNGLGVEVHATLADNLLRGDFLQRSSSEAGWVLLLTLAVALVSTLVLLGSRPLVGALIHLGLGLILWQGGLLLLDRQGLYLPTILPILFIGSNFTLLTLGKYIQEQRLVGQRSQELATAQNFIMQALTALAEIRDSETGHHILRTQKYVRVLCEDMAAIPRFARALTPDTVEIICRLAPLHDIGKVGVPDCLLRKRGQLDEAEFEEVKKHTILGLKAIETAEARVDGYVDYTLQIAKDIVYCHHEWWNGGGYPQGLRGEEIPLAGRMMALVDVYDALVSKRIYKEAVSHEEAVRIIREASGAQFDPVLVEAFLRGQERWGSIALSFADEGPALAEG
ncbi:MAG: CHASE2 domain-containing protein [Trichloromonadaceae bacterium]